MPAHFSRRTARSLMPVALVGLVMAILGTVLTTAPAQGAVPALASARVAMAGETGDAVTVSTHDVAGYDVPCFRETIVVTSHYDASSSGTWSGRWSALAQIEDVGGELHNLEYDGFDASKSLSFQLCSDYFLDGSYRVFVSWYQYDAEGATIAEGNTVGSFEYTLKPRETSHLTVTKTRYGKSGWTFGSRLTRVGKPIARQSVQIWIRWKGSWRNFEETKRTNDRGRVSWHTRGNLRKNSFVFQLRYPGNFSTKPARSSTFRLQGR